MTGLTHIPTLKQLSKIYERLMFCAGQVRSEEWALWTQYARFDARLAELLVMGFYKHWINISPIALNEYIREKPWPAAMGVILEHTKIGLGKSKDERLRFEHWMKLATFGIQKASSEQFFIGIWKLGSEQMKHEAFVSTKPYSLWGYVGRSFLWNKQNPIRTIATSDTRLNAIERILKKKPRFRVKDYIEELDHTVSLRQAQRDLSGHPGLESVGNTQGKYYVRR